MSRWHAVGVGLAAFALTAAGTQVQRLLPGDEDNPGAAPFVRGGVVGEPVDVRAAVVTVDEVLGSRTVLEFGSELVTPGVWVIARYTVTATRETTRLTHVELTDGERRWSLAGRNEAVCTASPPGVPVHCTAYLEVPPEALPDLRLRLARDDLDQRYDAVAEIDLGLTAADAETFAEAPPFELGPAVVGGEVSP